MTCPSGLIEGISEEDRVLQPGEHLRVAGGGHVVREFHGHLRRADLGGVDGAGDEGDGLPFGHQSPRLLVRQPLGIGQAAGDLAVAVEMLLVLRRGEDHERHLVALRRAPSHLDRDAVGGGVERAQVAHHPRPRCQEPVLTHLVAEELLGGRDCRLSSPRWLRESQECRDQKAKDLQMEEAHRRSLSKVADPGMAGGLLLL